MGSGVGGARVEPAVIVRDALAQLHAQHGYDRGGYTAARFPVKLGFFTLLLPNPRYLPLHDLHHTALGAPPTFWGEVEVSAFELRSGTPTAFIMLLCVGALFLGAFARPAQVWRWLARYRGARNLYRRTEYETLLALELTELRREMGLDDLQPVGR